MITVKEVDKTYFDLYDQVSMNVEVHSIYTLKRLDSGLSGFIFDEVPVNEYMLTNHNPNNIEMPSASMEGKVIGITIHNTDWITTIEGTTPAEQYTRATVNGNMKDVRVHYYCDDTCAWQNLPLTLSGWHAADGDES